MWLPGDIHKSPAASLKDLVANQRITVVFHETDGDQEATISRPSFFCDLWLEIKAQKITLEDSYHILLVFDELCTIFLNYADDGPACGF